MSRFITSLINEDIDYKYSRIHAPFGYYSDRFKREIWIPPPFIHDYESVPLIKGTSKRGGVLHDYACRKNSSPVFTKIQAAGLYLEAMRCDAKLCRKKNTLIRRVDMWWRRWVKYCVVLVAPGYFHKHNVEATYEEMAGQPEPMKAGSVP